MQCGDIMDLMDCPNDANSLIGANPGSVILPVRTISAYLTKQLLFLTAAVCSAFAYNLLPKML